MILDFKNIIVCFFMGIVVSACWNPAYKAIKELENTTFDNTSDLFAAKRAISFIEKSQLDSLQSMFPSEVIKSSKESDWKELIVNGKEAINLSPIPPDSKLQISNTINMNKGVKQIFAKFSFPYSNNSTEKFINIVVSEGKLYGLNIGDYPFGRRIVEPQHNVPHLQNQSLDYSSINWFRIWYGSGFEKNDYGDRFGYYAVSGEKQKLDELEIQSELTQLFELINIAQPDSTDFTYLREEPIGNPEYIYLRFKLDISPYDKFGEFTIYHHLKDEPGKPEPMSKYITIKHSNKTRYLFLVENNPKIVALLKKITFGRYDKYFERRWM